MTKRTVNLNDIWMFGIYGHPKDIISLIEDVESEFGEDCIIFYEDESYSESGWYVEFEDNE